MKADEESCKLFWNGNSMEQGGVETMISSGLVKDVIEVKHVHARVIVVEMAIENQTITLCMLHNVVVILKKRIHFTVI